jgi:hypothetical protein
MRGWTSVCARTGCGKRLKYGEICVGVEVCAYMHGVTLKCTYQERCGLALRVLPDPAGLKQRLTQGNLTLMPQRELVVGHHSLLLTLISRITLVGFIMTSGKVNVGKILRSLAKFFWIGFV